MTPKPQEVVIVDGVSIAQNKDAGAHHPNNHHQPLQQMRSNAFVNNAYYHDDGLPACLAVATTTKGKEDATEDANKAAVMANNESLRHMDFDDLLPHIGEFGMYQKLLFLLMIPFAFSVAFVYFTQIFITLVPEEHWCRVPELEHLSVEDRWVMEWNGKCAYKEIF